MNKLLVICGPTATGKTSLALDLARKLVASAPAGEMISADSRQVYKGMDIGTGKDLPKNPEFSCKAGSRSAGQISKTPKVGGFYLINGVKLWGYDLVEPTQEFSVGQYIKIARKVINDIWSRKKLPILVGGTGFYIKGVVGGIETAAISKDTKLRKSLERKSVGELFEILTKHDPVKAASLNISDKKNPRRLIRALEIALSKLPKNLPAIATPARQCQSMAGGLKRWQAGRLIGSRNVFFVGLKASREFLNQRIKKRVEKRLDLGIEKEIKNLLRKGVGWDNQSMAALGYRQWARYESYLLPDDSCLRRKSDHASQAIRKEVIKSWIRSEQQYAKKQMTWFKRDKRINWFDITKKGWKKDVLNIVRKWYSSK